MEVRGLDVVYAAIDEVNAQAVDKPQINKSPDTPLFGEASTLDSLAFVNLVVAIEQQIVDRTGRTVVLVDEAAMALEDSPFLTVDTLAAHLERVLA